MTGVARPRRKPSESIWRRFSVPTIGAAIDSIPDDCGIGDLLAHWPSVTRSLLSVAVMTQLSGHAAPIEDEGADNLRRWHDRGQVQPLIGPVRITTGGAVTAGGGAGKGVV